MDDFWPRLPGDLVVGVVSAIVAVILLQVMPPPVTWASEVDELTDYDRPPVWVATLSTVKWLRWLHQRGPIDVEFRARFAYQHRGWDRILEIPVSKEWRPSWGGTSALLSTSTYAPARHCKPSLRGLRISTGVGPCRSLTCSKIGQKAASECTPSGAVA